MPPVFRPHRQVNGVWFPRRQWEVGSLIAAGYSTKEIARGLYLAEGTIKSHTQRLFEAANVTDRTKLALWWVGALDVPKHNWPVYEDLRGLGALVRRMRAARSMTIEQLAVSAELHVADIERIESGRQNLTARTLHKLSRALDTTFTVTPRGWE